MSAQIEGPRTGQDAETEGRAGQADQGQDTSPIGHDDGFTPTGPTPTEAAEVALLGAIILRSEARDDATNLVSADDFLRDAHRLVFEAIVGLHPDPVDVVTVTDRLAVLRMLDAAGGPAAIASLTSLEACPTPEAWPVYATIVAREGRRRRGIALLQRAIDRLEAGEDPAIVSAELAVVA